MGEVLALSLNPALDLSVALDTLTPGTVNRASESRMSAAGKGNNVARVLAALGHEVTVSGFLGRDNAGVFERAFADWGVIDEFVRVPGDTRINIKLAEQSGRVSDINAAGASISAEAWQQLEQRFDKQLARSPAAVVIAGSLPPGVVPEQLGRLIVLVRERGIPVWLDTSGEALIAGLKACPTAAKPNEHELAEWVGTALNGEAEQLAAARQLVESGIDDLFLSLGERGVCWCYRTPDGQTMMLRARPPQVRVVNTVGAGDTLLAGLLHARLSQWSGEAGLRFATALSADAVRRIGVGRSDGDDFATLCEQVRLEAVS
ncbi:1-phosphofructokinase [Kushneria phosphatilytica]|uniref:Phosphofructokinase n=1 Tax=Kushneria phosphatilytica TaxID=657387 RepID=A0A1S1NZ72_9GAMM|nr:1-phosphofructokinase [Kushneria phosphatilytica]OHV13816.1 1-phosphofructokinase [Kushneria phosphatilytica]QEL10369.1 1-phosphofructokinase [Kushneria phosphatilytica]